MPRPLVFGNGRLLVQIDRFGNIRDLCWPIGVWNHLSGRAIRTGVWVDGAFAWLDSGAWSRKQRYVSVEPLVGEEVFEDAELGIRLTFREGTNPIGEGPDVFIRQIQVQNLRAAEREVRVFMAHDLRLMESDIGECALWHPRLRGLVHYKGHCAVLLRAHGDAQYTCGEAGRGGEPESWRDAEDGLLSGVPIAQGTTDSCLGMNFGIGPHSAHEFAYEIAFAENIEALEDAGPFAAPTPDEVRGSERGFHVAIIATQTSDGGAILAANDSAIMGENRANYACCWPRDGALVAQELLQYPQVPDARQMAERLLRFGLALLQRRPYFRQKYRADGALGSSWHPWTIDLPIQLDETASFVSFAMDCRRAGISMNDDEVAAGILRPTEFLLDYSEADLPKPCYDLWEERRGIFAYTVATVIRAIRDASELKPEFGEQGEKMQAAFSDRFWNADGYFQQGLEQAVPDSSTLHVGLLGILSIGDERVQQNARTVEEALWVREGIGGLARYPGDYYHRVGDHYPGNPWIITTLWLAQHEALSGRDDRARELLDWAKAHIHETGVLPEQVHPETGEPLSVSPLTWSHAEMLKTLRVLEIH